MSQHSRTEISDVTKREGPEKSRRLSALWSSQKNPCATYFISRTLSEFLPTKYAKTKQNKNQTEPKQKPKRNYAAHVTLMELQQTNLSTW